MITCVDLFCGAGGLSYGMARAGVHVALGVDSEQTCAAVYTANISKFMCADMRSVSADAIRSRMTSKYAVIAGCAPCQTFSTYARNVSNKDSRFGLIFEVFRVVKEIRPEFVVVENVPSFIQHQNAKKFCYEMGLLGYGVDARVIDFSMYGLPQRRKRFVGLFSIKGLNAAILPPEHFSVKANVRTVYDAIFDLPAIGCGEVCATDYLHRSAKLTTVNLLRIQNSLPGGTWRTWPDELKLRCHKRDAGGTFTSIYGRLLWDKPSPTLTTQFYNYGAGRFGHPEQDRALSLREGARLQSFPDSFIFTKSHTYSITSIAKMIGNAVPPVIGEVIGKSILASIHG